MLDWYCYAIQLVSMLDNKTWTWQSCSYGWLYGSEYTLESEIVDGYVRYYYGYGQQILSIIRKADLSGLQNQITFGVAQGYISSVLKAENYS